MGFNAPYAITAIIAQRKILSIKSMEDLKYPSVSCNVPCHKYETYVILDNFVILSFYIITLHMYIKT